MLIKTSRFHPEKVKCRTFGQNFQGGPTLRMLTKQDYLALCQGARVLEADGHGEKVLQLPDGSIVKLFRRKRLLSSALLYPYVRRFARNAVKLSKIGVPVPEILEVLRIPEIARDAVHYLPLAGESLRHLARQTLPAERKVKLRAALNQLIVHLHQQGIYFRSLHLGNVIVGPDDRLGLIDFSDMRIYPWALGPYLRRRNLQRMLDEPGDAEWVDMVTILGRAHQ